MTTQNATNTAPKLRQKRVLRSGTPGYKMPANRTERMKAIVANQADAATTCMNIGVAAYTYLQELNQRLIVISRALFEHQPQYEKAIKLGRPSIALELYLCGKQCLGCAHPRWIRYEWYARKPTLNNPHEFAPYGRTLQSDPVLSVSKSARNREQLLALVREAKALIATRKKLISRFSLLGLIAGDTVPEC